MVSSAPSSSVRRAVIDVGTNSVKLLVADIGDGQVHPVEERSEQTRLGKGFYETHRLQPEAIESTSRSVARFGAMARELGAKDIRVIATSAARDALNPEDLLTAIEAAAGLKVHIIPGDIEADWTFRGVTSDPRLADAPLLILDIGGGSTEFIVGRGQTQTFRESFNLGTVRLLEHLPPADPPDPGDLIRCDAWLRAFLQTTVRTVVQAALLRPAAAAIQLVGTGGTTTILARMEQGSQTFDRTQIEASLLTREMVCRQRDRLWSLPLARRKELAGLPASRADVILGGVAILAAVMEELNFETLRVSTRGVRFGAALSCP